MKSYQLGDATFDMMLFGSGNKNKFFITSCDKKKIHVITSR